MSSRRYTQGFTIIEMTIALAFLSMLILSILMLTVSAGKLYVKGITNKTINESGRQVQDIMRRDFRAADISRIVPDPPDPNVANQPYVILEGDAIGDQATRRLAGRICLGGVSYLWNNGAMLRTPLSGTIIRNDASPATAIRFVRVIDENASMCIPNPGGGYPSAPVARSTELLGTDAGLPLAMHNVGVTRLDKDGKQGLYRINYTLGTNEANSVEFDTAGGYVRCKTNDTLNANFNFCAVSGFSMIVRVGGGGN